MDESGIIEFTPLRGPQKPKDPLDEIRQDLKDIKNLLTAMAGATKPAKPESLKFFTNRQTTAGPT